MVDMIFLYITLLKIQNTEYLIYIIYHHILAIFEINYTNFKSTPLIQAVFCTDIMHTFNLAHL